jgi:DNA repair exonuclease SbcCD ATPase subunit
VYISEIKLKNFKKFDDAKFRFEHGINVIKGANEQGKSTLLKAIIAGLFADTTSSKTKEAFKSWNKEVYPTIELDFFIGENLYALLKDFNSKEMVLKDVINNTEEKNFSTITKQIKEFSGIGSEAVLRNTACINHDEMTDLESGRKSLQEVLQELSMNGGKTNILQIARELQAKMDELQVGLYHPAKNNGVIKRLQDEIAERSSELESLKSKGLSVDNSSEKLASLTKELAQVDSQIEKYTKIVSDYEKKDTVQKEIDDLSQKIKDGSMDVTKINEFNTKIQETQTKMGTLGGRETLEVLDGKMQEVVTLNQRMQKLQESLLQPQPQPVAPVVVEKKNSFGLMYVVLSFLALIFVICGAVFFRPLVFVGIFMVVLNLIFIFFLHDDSDEDESVAKTPTVPPMQQELAESQTQMQTLLRTCNIASLDEFFSKRTQLIALNSDLTQMQSTIEALLRGSSVEALNEQMRGYVAQKTEAEAKLPQNDVVGKDEYLRDKRELELLALDKKDITNEMTEEKTKIKVVDVTPEDITSKETKLQSLQKELSDNQYHVTVLKMVYDAFMKTKDIITTNISENIESYVKQSLSALTNGKYDSMKMDNDFNIQIFSKERNGWVNPSNLSKGTIDQVYLSARLALANIITGGKPVPLFFDDPFLTFDEKRRNALMEELKKISTDHQIFIFTCHDFFDGFGNLVSVSEN